MVENNKIKLLGRLFITGNIQIKTGLHIGGTNNDFSIGGVDNAVILNPLDQRPYIPGSSLRGKMRSLTERYYGCELRSLGKTRMHQPNNKEAYDNSPVANLYGIPAEDFNLPTRLIVRDVFLTNESAEQLKRARTGLPYTEIKTEVSIDRITSAANPRPLERVPAGATFGPMELIINFYLAEDANLVATLIDGMQLLEGDYLGGGGARGNGKVVFTDLNLKLMCGTEPIPSVDYADLGELLTHKEGIIEGIASELKKVSL